MVKFGTDLKQPPVGLDRNLREVFRKTGHGQLTAFFIWMSS